MSEVYVTRSAPPQSCLSRSKEWEGRLERALRLWHQVQQKAQPVEEWMTRAEDVLTQTGDDIDQLITDHKVHTPGSAQTTRYTRCLQGQQRRLYKASEEANGNNVAVEKTGAAAFLTCFLFAV